LILKNRWFNQKGHLLYHSQLSAVAPNSVAAKAGLKVGDQVIAVNNELVSAERSLTSIIQNYRPGDKILLKISRNELEQEIEVQL
jgi:S1-C subfamily serine protease